MLINILVFGICFFVMLFLTFLPPILTGIVFVLLIPKSVLPRMASIPEAI